MASQTVEREAYGGTLHIQHDPQATGSKPRYIVVGESGTMLTPRGVTTIIGQIINKDFVNWALMCMEEDILSKLYIANSNDEYLTEADVAHAKLESRRRADYGARIGTVVHASIENYLKGQTMQLSRVSKDMTDAIQAFVNWFEDIEAKVIDAENVIYSQKMNYAGTYDAYIRINKKKYLVDFKTTNASKSAPRGVYPENFIQLGGYAEARLEEFPDQAIDGLLVVSIRKDGQLDVIENRDIGLSVMDCRKTFLKVRELSLFLNTVSRNLTRKRLLKGVV